MTTTEILNDLLHQFSKRTYHDRPFIVAIDGLSGAGKTTLTKKLKDYLECRDFEVVVIHMDDHIVERNKRYDTGHEEWYEYYYLQWNIDMLTNQLFAKLHQNPKILTLPFYDQSTDTTSTKKINVSPASTVLIEGIFLQRKEWRDFFDYIIFLDCPRELRFERVLNRDSYLGDLNARLNKYKRRYWKAEDHYINSENPMVNADKVNMNKDFS